jgi:transcriptional regulator GlxA family with amidase domain
MIEHRSTRRVILNTPRTRNVAIVLYEGVEILDFAGPYEVFAAAAHQEGHPFEVFTIADRDDLLTCSGGLVVKPRYTLENHPPVDLLVVPGGSFRPDEPANQRLVEWIRRNAESIEILSSVCTGAGALGRAGLLDGKQATTHWGAIERMRELFPAAEIVTGTRFVDTGKVVTAAGVSAGIDMALHLVERLCGREVAEQVARYMEYDWKVSSAVSA